jgi:predicted DNA-binding protein with PD1-like motif
MQHIKLSKAGNYCIRIDKGQDVIQAITEFCNINKITFASFCGIGATNDAVVSIYNTKTKKYEDRKITRDAEILSLNGNVSLFENKPFVHAHIVLGINESPESFDGETSLTAG